MHAHSSARQGRPQGEFRRLLVKALQEAPGTSRELAQRTGIAQRVTMYTLADMVRAGDVDSTQRVRRPGVKRPVPVYALPAAVEADAGHVALVDAWMRQPAASGGQRALRDRQVAENLADAAAASTPAPRP